MSTADTAVTTKGERDIDVGEGLQLHVVSSGNGQPLVLLHGFTGSTQTWEPLRAALEERFSIHAVDLPGHGRSTSPGDRLRYALDRFAADLAKILDTFGLDRVAVLGYSLGARAALRFAIRQPRRLSALILESGTPGITDAKERIARLISDQALAESIENDGVAAFVNEWESRPMWDSQSRLGENARAALRAQRLANDARGLANSVRGSGVAADPPMTDRLPHLSVPTLLIVGALDQKFVAIGRDMEAAIPNGRLAVVEDAGHAVHLEQPRRFADLVAEFLASPR